MPRYWRFLFGDPAVCGYPFTGGVYPVGKTGPGVKQDLQMVQGGVMRSGDRALLYCAASYSGHRQTVVGYGEIVSIAPRTANEWDIRYTLLQFPNPVTWTQMLMLATPSDAMNLRSHKRMWITELDTVTFNRVVKAGG